MSKRIQFNDSDGNVYPNGYVQTWTVVGNIMFAPNLAASYGRATITFDGSIYRIEFSVKVTASNNDTSSFNGGIMAIAFTSTVGKLIEPISLMGHWRRWVNGVRDVTYDGYGTCFVAANLTGYGGYWRLARTYTTSGDVGSWPVGTIFNSVNNTYEGVVYGR